ncbi:MAG: inner rane transporter RhtA, partial [Mycobacterium sp.]|nr:inner rane transporter RhtA [Mycobacterium sp.]
MQRRPTTPIPGWSVPLLFVVGAISQYVGAAIGVFLFETTEPSTVAWLRAAAAAVALLLWRMPWRGGLTRHDAFIAVQFGLVTIAMNIAFYEAIARIPLGTAVAIEFLGPIAVAALSSRRAVDLVAAVLVCAGVVLLAGFEFDVDRVGFGFALASAALWAGYILLGKRVADSGEGLDSLALGMAIGAAVLAPFVLIPQAHIDSSVFVDPRTWVLGVAVGLLSTAVPYALDQLVLKVVGRAKFA